MIDKEQIMINGVTYYKQQDINEGLDEEHYITEFHLLATHYNLLLEDYARKTQECEELKIYIESNEQQVKEVETLVMDNDRLINELDRLKAENDELKKKCNIYTCGICGNKEDCNKLYKTLTEIKEIAENRTNYPCDKCIKTEILQKNQRM